MSPGPRVALPGGGLQLERHRSVFKRTYRVNVSVHEDLRILRPWFPEAQSR